MEKFYLSRKRINRILSEKENLGEITMRFLTLAYKNLKRRRIRTVLTILGVGIAVAVLVSLLGFNIGYKAALNRDIERMGYQVIVTAKGCPYEAATIMLKGGGGLRYITENLFSQIAGNPLIDEITPQLIEVVHDPDLPEGGGFRYFLGIEMKSFHDLRPWIKFKSGGWFSGNNVDEVIMGYEAAELEQRLVGDKIFIPGVDKVLIVAGIFERVGTQDDGTMFLPLKTLQRIFKREGKLTGMGLRLKDMDRYPEFEEEIFKTPEIQVISMSKVRMVILNLIGRARLMVISVAFIAIFVAVIGVLNTILMSTFERTQEIGIMKAVGASRFHIFKIIWLETILICAAGGIAGAIIAIVASSIVAYLARKVLPYVPSGKLVVITPDLLLICFLGAIVMGLLAGIYPALRASGKRPVEAISSTE